MNNNSNNESHRRMEPTDLESGDGGADGPAALFRITTDDTNISSPVRITPSNINNNNPQSSIAPSADMLGDRDSSLLWDDDDDDDDSDNVSPPKNQKKINNSALLFRRSSKSLLRRLKGSFGAQETDNNSSNNSHNNCNNDHQSTHNRAVRGLRWLLALVLISSAGSASYLVYAQTSGQEHNDFEQRFQSDAKKLLEDIGSKFALTMGAADAFMFRVVSEAKSSGSKWPFVTIPDLAVQSAKLLSKTDSIYMAFYPLIQQDQRQEWENFTRHNDEWVEQAMRVQSRNPHYHGPVLTEETMNYTRSSVIWRNEGPEPYTNPGPFLPSWLGSPVIPSIYPPYNWNALAYPAFASGLFYTMDTKSVVVTSVANHADPNDPESVAQAEVTNDWAIPYLAHDEDPSEPFSDMYYPILENTDNVVIDTSNNHSSAPALGAVAFSFFWRHTLKNVLPRQSRGLVLVFDNPCNGHQSFTYQVDGRTPTFLGYGDLHETKFDGYDHLVETTTLADLTSNLEDSTSFGYTGLPINPDFCPFTITVYPSTYMKDNYITNTPIHLALGAAFIFIFVAALFWVYDCLIQREVNAKQQLLEAKRHFMRFVSHEVRTPLNAVCLGLSVLQDELCQAVLNNNKSTGNIAAGTNQGDQAPLLHKTPYTTDNHDTTLAEGATTNNTELNAWLDLTKEICESAESSVDVLNDLLNYDKIQMGNFSMEFSVFAVRQLVHEISREFRLSARKKNIHFVLDNRLMLEQRSFRSLKLNDYDDDDENSIKFDADTEKPELDSLKIVGDRIRLAQVLRNLVSNSLKFTAEDGHLTMRTTWAPFPKGKHRKVDKYTLKCGKEVTFTRHGVVNICVVDSGIGMSEAQLQSLFQDGKQFNANELQAGNGSGLGLFISKGMAQQHGGELKAASAGLGHGSMFTLQLPVYNIDSDSSGTVETTPPSSSPSPETGALFCLPPSTLQSSMADMTSYSSLQIPHSPAPAPAAVAGNTPSLRILVVDDVASNRKLISRMARNRNHIVDERDDGRGAVEAVQAVIANGDSPYDTILMDYEMPILKGPDAVLEIRKLGCTSFIVGVTGNVLEEDISHFTSCGANFVLPKPVKFQNLEELWKEHGIVGSATTHEEDESPHP